MAQQIKWILTHRPHLDEIFAVLLLQQYGEEKYPGVVQAKVRVVSGGNALIPHEESCLYVGVSSDGPDGGKFDEHPAGNEVRKDGQSASSLVAVDLGIDKNPEVRLLLDFVTKEDQTGKSDFLSLAPMVKLLHDEYPNDPLYAFDWAMVALKARLNEQRALNDTAELAEFERRVTVTETVFGGNVFKIGVIETDNPLASKFARMKGINVLIQANKDGHIQIFTRKQDTLDMRDVVRLLRLEELGLTDRPINSNWRQLEDETCEECPTWYFHAALKAVMNGSKTATDVPVTKVSVLRILHLVKMVFSDNSDHLQCKLCNNKTNRCRYYSAGFVHCRTLRHQAKKTQQPATENSQAA
jgi:hypothetical protein